MAQSGVNLYLKTFSEFKIENFFQFVSLPFVGLYHGVRYRLLPMDGLVLASSALCAIHNLGLDIYVFNYLHLIWLYPRTLLAHLAWNGIYFVWPYLAWGFLEGGRRLRFKKSLEEILTTAGLKSPLGKTPQVLGMYPLDESTTKLVLSKISFSIDDFFKAKNRIESGLRGFIDDIKENRTRGAVEIIFSTLSMPTSIRFRNVTDKGRESFLVGATRANDVCGDLDRTPHLLVAGQTGGGKSTFLRNFITTIYLNSKNARFTLIDLKGGLEFQIFEGLPRVEVLPNLNRAVDTLNSLESELNRRVDLLKKCKAKDMDELAKKEKGSSFIHSRRVIVVDEAAELFLTGGGSEASKIIQARRILSQIARKGRAAGMNLVVATQRPDSRSLDPQVKANLPGVLCFPMQNDSSSITVLGNGRATDLPLIPGRAIWKEGPSMTEVQTPYLSVDEADQLLEPHRISKSNSKAEKS